MSDKNHDELVTLLKQQIAATNRATHALRAIVRPSTIMLVAILVALPLALIGYLADDLAALVFLAALVIIGGAIAAIVAQISETRKSDVPVTLEEANLRMGRM